MVVHNNYLNNINKVLGNRPATVKRNDTQQPKDDFHKILEGKINQNTGIKFSKHAELRLQTRNIEITEAQKQKIDTAVKRAEEKGVKESLVLLDDVALVVSVKNRTVITAVSKNELKKNVFTNIDGAVFA